MSVTGERFVEAALGTKGRVLTSFAATESQDENYETKYIQLLHRAPGWQVRELVKIGNSGKVLVGKGVFVGFYVPLEISDLFTRKFRVGLSPYLLQVNKHCKSKACFHGVHKAQISPSNHIFK